MKKIFISMFALTAIMLNATTGFSQQYLRHTVEFSETVYSIPVHYGITTPQFLEINHMDINHELKQGDVVIIRELTAEEIASANKPKEEKKPEQVEKKQTPHEIIREQLRAEVETPAPPKTETKPVVEDAPVKKEVEKVEVKTTPVDEDKTIDIGPNGIVYKISKNGYHVVEKKQTFYHIAQIYNISQDDLKKINNLTTTDLAIGQKLKVSRN